MRVVRSNKWWERENGFYIFYWPRNRCCDDSQADKIVMDKPLSSPCLGKHHPERWNILMISLMMTLTLNLIKNMRLPFMCSLHKKLYCGNMVNLVLSLVTVSCSCRRTGFRTYEIWWPILIGSGNWKGLVAAEDPILLPGSTWRKTSHVRLQCIHACPVLFGFMCHLEGPFQCQKVV